MSSGIKWSTCIVFSFKGADTEDVSIGSVVISELNLADGIASRFLRELPMKGVDLRAVISLESKFGFIFGVC